MQAGVSHCSVDSEGDYEYVGLYPKVGLNVLALLNCDAYGDSSFRGVLIGTATFARPTQLRQRRRPEMHTTYLFQNMIPYMVKMDRWWKFGRMQRLQWRELVQLFL